MENSGTVSFMNWNNCIQHVRPTEPTMMRVNEIQNSTKPFIIQLEATTHLVTIQLMRQLATTTVMKEMTVI